MEREFLKAISSAVTLNVTGGRIDSFRQQDETTGTVRVYDQGCIGVAGCLGEPDEDALTKKAIEALELQIPYPCNLEGALEQSDLHEEEIIPAPELIPTMQAFLDRLGESCPRFAFTGKIRLNYGKSEYRNSLGRHLISSGRKVAVELTVQNRGSGNLYDTVMCYTGNHFDPEAVLRQFKAQYDAYYNNVELEPGRYPVVMEPSDLLGTFFPHFLGEMYVSGASLLSGKLGEKIFSDKLTFQDDMNSATTPGVSFFDTEGCVAPNLRPTLVQNGVLTGLLTTKKSAEQFGLPNLGTAAAAYDGVPGFGYHQCYLEPTAGSLKELVPGKAIYVVVASGGDTTPDGHFATPVQMAYLLEDGKLVGLLPELKTVGNYYELLSKDNLCAVKGDLVNEDVLMIAIRMDVEQA